MIAIEITDLKIFMNTLLLKETFDTFYLEEATLKTAQTFVIDGHLNKEFYTKDPDKLWCQECFNKIQDNKFNECPNCKIPLERKIGKYGAFLGCPNYPDCEYTQKI